MFDIFFREKPAMILIQLRNTKGSMYASSLAKSVDCTYSHVVNIIHYMEKYKLVEFQKKGRLKLLKLTEKGSKIADHFSEVKNLLA